MDIFQITTFMDGQEKEKESEDKFEIFQKRLTRDPITRVKRVVETF